MNNFKEYTENVRDQHFKGRRLEERYNSLMVFLRTLRKATNTLTSNQIDMLHDMIRNESLPEDHKVNVYLKNLLDSWVSEMFSIIVEPKRKPTILDTGGEPDEKGLIYDDEYDPEMLALAGEHPEEYSIDVLREEIQEQMGTNGKNDDE